MQTPGNYPEEITQHSEHGESFKSRIVFLKLQKKGSASFVIDMIEYNSS